MSKIVYIVHCIDTEGPMYESPEVPFEQINKVFGIKINPTEDNLKRLRKRELDLGGIEEAVSNLVDVRKVAVGGDWAQIEKMLEKITSREYREILKDSNGNGWIYSWFCLDHVGFTGNNPRRRDLGHHRVFDRYMKMVREQDMGDIIQFHHHPVSFSGNANENGTAYWGRNTLNEILCRKVIDRQWFPVAFRPGFHVERPDSHWFLEQWIPFDYGNQAVNRQETNQPDMAEGRFGDWRLAPAEWRPYHPSYKNYQLEGNCNRWITRCLNMYARLNEISQNDVNDAFEQARRYGKAILAFTDHDFKDMAFDIDRVRGFIKKSSELFYDVKFEYTDAVTAMRKYNDLQPVEVGLKCRLIDLPNGKMLEITTENDIFGSQPYFAIKTKKGEYLWDNLDNGFNHKWTYTFDYNSIRYELVDIVGIVATSTYGNCEIVLMKDFEMKKKVV